MKKKETTKIWDAAEYLETQEDIVAYLEAALEENDPALVAAALDDKEYAAEVIKKQLIEAKRAAIAKRGKTAMSSFRKKMTKCGTVKELYKDLESD